MVVTGILCDRESSQPSVSSIVEELRVGDSAKFVALPLEGLHDRVLTSSDWQNYVIARIWSSDNADKIEVGLMLMTGYSNCPEAELCSALISQGYPDRGFVEGGGLEWREEGLVNFAHALKRLCFRPHSTAKFQSFWLRMNLHTNTGEQVSWLDWNTIKHPDQP